MTTIAANLECMAADTRIVGDVISRSSKMRRYGNRIFGCAGDMALITLFWEWAAAGFPKKKKPPLPEGSFDAIELDAEGIWSWDRSLCRYRQNDKFHAIGTGAMAAKAAIFMGKSPEDSIGVAAEFDENTGGPVEVEYLLPPALTRKKR